MQGNTIKDDQKQTASSLFQILDQILFCLVPDNNILSSGELAALRRMHPYRDAALPPIFWKLLCECDPVYEKLSRSSDDEKMTITQAWALVFQGMAMTAEQCYGAKDDFGKALGMQSESGDTLEKRFDLLIRAPKERFPDLLRHLLKLAQSKGCKFSWHDLSLLITETDDNKRTEIRRRLCDSFYRAQYNRHVSQNINEDNAKETENQ